MYKIIAFMLQPKVQFFFFSYKVHKEKHEFPISREKTYLVKDVSMVLKFEVKKTHQ